MDLRAFGISGSVTRARDRGGDDPEEPDLPPVEGDERIEVKDLKRVLEEIRGEPSESEKRSRAKSPGQTPKSSIHRNLAKLGMLDSPAKDEPIPLLEDFFNQYAEGRSLGLSEEDVRDSLAVERGIPLEGGDGRAREAGHQGTGQGPKGAHKVREGVATGGHDTIDSVECATFPRLHVRVWRRHLHL